MTSPRRIASITLAIGLIAGIPGCFAIFPLDEYHEGRPVDLDGGVPSEAEAPPDGGVDATDSEAGSNPNQRLVFVTNGTVPGNLQAQGQGGTANGAAAGDAFCTDSAKKAGRAGSFKALLSDSSVLARTRVTEDASKTTRTIVDTTGHAIAPSIAQLFQNGPSVVISRTETGDVVEVGDGTCSGDAVAIVWTGSTSVGGRADSSPCNNWKSNATSTSAQVGIINVDKWLNGSCAQTCDKQAHLYCLQE